MHALFSPLFDEGDHIATRIQAIIYWIDGGKWDLSLSVRYSPWGGTQSEQPK